MFIMQKIDLLSFMYTKDSIELFRNGYVIYFMHLFQVHRLVSILQ